MQNKSAEQRIEKVSARTVVEHDFPKLADGTRNRRRRGLPRRYAYPGRGLSGLFRACRSLCRLDPVPAWELGPLAMESSASAAVARWLLSPRWSLGACSSGSMTRPSKTRGL
jgi:hypothetical protein